MTSHAQDVVDTISIPAHRIVFNFKDTYYPHTLNIYPDKHFSIHKGFIEKPEEWHQPFKIRRKKTVLGDKYVYRYQFDSIAIDTLISYIPYLDNTSIKDTIDIELYDTMGRLPMYPKLDTSMNLYYEIKHSYIFRIMQEPNLNHLECNRVIRLVYYDGSFPYIKSYHSVRVAWQNDSVKIFYSQVNLDDLINQKLSVKDSSTLKKGDIKRLEKYISKINFKNEGVDCLSKADSWLLEYKIGPEYYAFIRGEPEYARRYEDSIIYFFGLSNMLRYLGQDYF